MRWNGRMVAVALTGLLVAGGTVGGYLASAGTAKADNAGTCIALWAAGGTCTIQQTVTSVQDVSLQITPSGIPKGVTYSTQVSWSTTCDGAANSNSQAITPPLNLFIFSGFARSCDVTAKVSFHVNNKMPQPLPKGDNPGMALELNFTPGSPTSSSSPPPPGGGGGGLSGAVRGFAGKCIDDTANSSSLRAKVQIWNCNHGKSQQWSYSGGELKHNGLCLNAKGGGGVGSKVILWTCTGAPNEIFVFDTLDNTVKLKAHGFTECVDDPAFSTKNGTQLDVYTCRGSANERWSLPGH